MNVALAWRPQKGSGADLAMHMQRTVVWKRVQRVLTHPDVEKALKLKLAIDAPIKFREFFFVRELPGHSLGVHTGNNGKKARRRGPRSHSFLSWAFRPCVADTRRARVSPVPPSLPLSPRCDAP